MSKIILSEEAQNGIQGVTKRKMKISKSYQKLIDEADQKIDESRSNTTYNQNIWRKKNIKTLKIYEAGKMSGISFEEMNRWRNELKEKLEFAANISGYLLQVINHVDYYNFEEKRYQSEEEVEDYDLMHVISSDIIIVNLNGLNTSDGTKIELHEAKYNNKIPVIAFGDYGLYKNLHPWIQRAITRVETTMEDTVNYIKDFYMI